MKTVVRHPSLVVSLSTGVLVIARCRSGLQVVYKPKSLAVDRHSAYRVVGAGSAP